MARYGSDDVALLLIDGYDVLGTRTEIKDDVEALTEETHGFGDDWVKHAFTGLSKFSLEQDGYFDDASVSVHEALSGKSGLERILSWGVEGNEEGKRCLCLESGLQVNHKILASRGGLHRCSAKYEGAGAVEECIIIQPLGWVVGDQAPLVEHDFGALYSNWIFYVHLSDIVWGDAYEFRVRLRWSVDGIDWSQSFDPSATQTFPYGAYSTGARRVARESGSPARYIQVETNWYVPYPGDYSAKIMVAGKGY